MNVLRAEALSEIDEAAESAEKILVALNDARAAIFANDVQKLGRALNEISRFVRLEETSQIVVSESLRKTWEYHDELNERD